MKRNFLNPAISTAKVLFIAALMSTSAQGQIITVAGAGGAGYSGDGGAATLCTFSSPTHIAKDGAGNIYVTDIGNARLRKIDVSGVINTLAGTGSSAYSGDGGAASAASMKGPTGVAVDRAGNVYISDANDYRIRKVNTAGIISTYAGTGTTGFGGDGGPASAARLSTPNGLAIDTAGNLYIADKGNNRIRKITAAGVISTIAGVGGSGYSGDGGAATTAQIKAPIAVAVDNAGNVYIADQGNNRIRKISSGIITTFAGNGTAGYSGDGGAATAAMIANPGSVTVDNAGNVYIADVNNHRVRKVTPAGIISTYAGQGSAGYSGDGGAATAAQLNFPSGVVIDASNSLYVADKTNGRVRKVFGPNHAPLFVGGVSQALAICQNAAATSINGLMQINDTDADQTATWTVVTAPAHGSLAGFSLTRTTTGAAITPTGTTYTPTSGYSGADSFKISIGDGTATAFTTVHVTINPLPSAGTISGSASVCEGGGIITLTTTGSGGTWSATNGNATVVSAGTVTGITAGIDTILYSVTNSCGSSSAMYVITVNPLPVVAAITGTPTVMVGSVVTLANATAGGTWSSSIAGVATVSATGDVTGVAAGTATISYAFTNGAGCTGYATLSFTVTPFLSVSSLAQAGAGVSVYPNPAGNNVTLSWQHAVGGNAAVTIADITGIVVYNSAIDLSVTGKKQIDLSALPSGLYLIKLTTESGNYFEKLEVVK